MEDKSYFYTPVLKFFKNPFTNYHLKRISTSVFWKFSPLLLYTADFFWISANIFWIIPLLIYKADFFAIWKP